MAILAAPVSADVPQRIAAPPIIRATPALWEIHDTDTTIYLFGTFHTLDERTVWFSDEVHSAFDRSSELVLETVVPKDPADIDAAARSAVGVIGPDGKRVIKPFIAQTRSAVRVGRSIGLSIDHGADAVLRRVADQNGKPVAGLETFEEQLKALSNIPVSPPATAIAAASTTPVAVTLNDLLDAWKSGDTAAFSTMLSGFEAKAPIAYRLLIADRNARWGDWIAERLNTPGTVFVAVGAGHLAGKDSVQARLAARGIATTRAN